jgi:hypothetical protein
LLAICWAAARGCGPDHPDGFAHAPGARKRARQVRRRPRSVLEPGRAEPIPPPVLIMIVTGMAPRRRNELGLNASGVRRPRRLQRGVAVERGARREAYRRSVSVGPGRGGVDRRVRHLLGPRPRRHPGLGSPMGNGARPSRMRSPPRPRRDRARVGTRSVRDSERAARLTPSPAIGHLRDADHDDAVPGARRGRASGREGHDDRTDISCRPHNRQQPAAAGIAPKTLTWCCIAAGVGACPRP